MITLRPEQERVIAELKEKIREGKRSVLLQLPTGGGKTIIGATIMKGAAEKGNRTMFVVNRRELLEQTIKTFNSLGVVVGVISSGFQPDFDKHVQVASVDTIRARLDNIFYYPDIIIWDECRGIASRTWSNIKSHYSESLHIGLDATPRRLDKKPLRPYFEDIVIGASIKELINIGSLVPPRVYAPPEKIDLSSVKIKAGEYDAKELEMVMGTSQVIGDIISHYNKLANDGQGIVFCPTIEYSKKIATTFTENGIACVHLDGDTSKKIRKKIIEDYRHGKIRLLSNVGLFTAGFDVPNVSYIADASPTMSLADYLQRAGRGARPAEGKDYYIFADHAGNCFRHGMPDDEREWSLDAPPKKTKGDVAPPTKQCPLCFAVAPISAKICPACGEEFKRDEQEKLDASNVELIETKILPKLSQAELAEAVKNCKAIGELYDLARRQGYKPGWAYFKAQEIGLRRSVQL